MRKALINSQNVVVNVIELAPMVKYKVPAGHYLVLSETANIGDVYDPATQTFTQGD